jgi:ATP-dependent DNA ligase
MKNKQFKPLLCPNEEIDLNDLKYPLLVSTKMDGCRLLIKQGQIVTRSLKALPNIQLNQKFESIRKFSKEANVILDGEIFAPNIPFQFIVSCFMTEDCDDIKSIKKWTKLCQEYDYFVSRQEVFDKLKFYCFDCLTENLKDTPFNARLGNAENACKSFPELAVAVEHWAVYSAEEVSQVFDQVILKGYEGLILRNPKAPYKFGRARLSENIAYKLKPWKTVDSKIISVIQATEVNEDVEKTVNKLGYSRTSKRQEDRHTIDKAQAFVVNFNNRELSIPIALTDEQKKYIWQNKNEFIGKFIEYKFMTVGIKDLPRIPKMIRIREDKDE